MNRMDEYFKTKEKLYYKFGSKQRFAMTAKEARAFEAELKAIREKYSEIAKEFPQDFIDIGYELFLEKAPDGMTYKEYLKENGLGLNI